VLAPIYDYIDEFNVYSRNLCLISYSGKVGFVNRKGKVVTDPIYDYIDEFNVIKRNWAEVRIENHSGFVNRKGELVVFSSESHVQ
jgi:hypothetical protein